MPILAIVSSTRNLKLKLFGRNQQLCAMGQTDITTSRLNQPRADSVKIINKNSTLKFLPDIPESLIEFPKFPLYMSQNSGNKL